MSGGRAARWVDEDMADVLTGKATDFIERHRDERFFLYYATHDIHVPRVPHARFTGKSGLGPRGDVILQLDWATGRVLETLERLSLADRTLVIFTSDNGPVVDDGYRDEAVEKLGGHRPAGPLRGGKYSAFDGGTRVPMIVRWPGRVTPASPTRWSARSTFWPPSLRSPGRHWPGTTRPTASTPWPRSSGPRRPGATSSWSRQAPCP
jgi:arylsulfatase A-like enzyme